MKVQAYFYGVTHIGQLIKEALENSGMTSAEFARRINRSPQNVQDIFKRKSMDIGLVLEIGAVLKYDFLKHYKSEVEEVTEADAKPLQITPKKMSVVVELDGTEEGYTKWVKVLRDVNNVVRTSL